MKRLHVLNLIMAVLLLAPCALSHAQDRKLVTGRIINKHTGKPFGKDDIVINIYAFDTEAQAEDALKVLNEGTGFILDAREALPPDAGGYYQVSVAETGALIFKPDMAKGILEKVNYRMEINIALDVGEVIDAAGVTSQITGVFPLKEEIDIDGNYLNASNTIPVPKTFGKSTARLIMQPFLMQGGTDDTLRCLKPWIYDGTEYNLTQRRRMGYSEDNDPLMKFVLPDTLSMDEMRIHWRDTIYLADPSGSYYVSGVLQMEDYNNVYYRKDLLLASSRIRRPLKFLDYSMKQYTLDPMKYKERPRPERMNTEGNISLTFLIGKAELDNSDRMNQVYLDELKSGLLEIVRGEGSKLNEFHIVGTSSPDGSYAKNLALAKQRMKFAQSQIMSVLPKKVRDRVYMTAKAQVAPWSAVADLLEADSLAVQAAEVRAITGKYKDHDTQGAHIRRLPYYKSIIGQYLPKLRSVKYVYTHEVYRELTPQEILDRYRTDEEYISGKKHFALYEYWNLFQMIEDEKELEALYKRAYDESLADNGEPWILAAANLAESYLKRGVADTTILAPFVDLRYKTCNIVRKRMDGITEETINPEPVVANQLCMYLEMNNFRRASILAQILPNTEQNKMMKAFTMCLGGYYKGGKTPEERQRANEIFETVKESSPKNKVIMYLALNSKAGTLMAEKAMADLPQDDPLTYYLWAIVTGRKMLYYPDDIMIAMDAEGWLMRAFMADKKYIGIAATDGDIPEDLFDSVQAQMEGM